MSDEKIDIVVTWVDGNDPKWIEEKKKYNPSVKDNSATNNRFRDWDLLRYWFRGVEKFAPWVNHVFFVTCGQCPEWLDLNNPKLVFVRHEDYIPKEILPTFNSNTIEMYLHRIPDLSETFVLFNDDLFLISPTLESDFFINGLPRESALLGVLSSKDSSDVFPHIVINNIAVINKHFNKKKVMLDNWGKFFSFKYGKEIVRNVLLLPFAYFSDFRDLHLPASHLKSVFREVWEAEPEVLYDGTKSRFRSPNDVNHWMLKDWYMCKGQFVPRSPHWGEKFELGIDEGIYDYILNQSGKVVCVNDSSDDIDFVVIQKKLIEVFERLFPVKSSFEK